jgi:lambda family phage portal protein
MSWLRFFRRTPKSLPATKGFTREPRNREREPEAGPFAHRRWDGARTDRLNSTLWTQAHGQSINRDLVQFLESLRARCEHESFNNPLVAGVIRTHQVDLVGANGPRLQVRSDNAAFNTRLEQLWKQWWRNPDANGRMSGPEMLQCWVRSLWTNGEYFVRKVTDRSRPGPIKFALQTIPARRIGTPAQFSGDRNVLLGVRLSKEGKPKQYFVIDPGNAADVFQTISTEFQPTPPDLIQHGFLIEEADQVRGVPWLASSLATIAALRDFKRAVLESQRRSATQGVVYHTNHPDAEYIDGRGMEREFQPGQETYAAPGWTPMAIAPVQPNAQYEMFVKESLRELGRPVSMPLMMVLLSSADSNFASAHYDGQVYTRGLQQVQSLLEKWSLDDCVRELAAEAAEDLLRSGVGIPTEWHAEWTWPVPPYVNPKQMYDALRSRMEDGTASWTDTLACFGLDPDSTAERLMRDAEVLAELGIKPPWQRPIGRGGQEQGVGDAPKAKNTPAEPDDTTETEEADDVELAAT